MINSGNASRDNRVPADSDGPDAGQQADRLIGLMSHQAHAALRDATTAALAFGTRPSAPRLTGRSPLPPRSRPRQRRARRILPPVLSQMSTRKAKCVLVFTDKSDSARPGPLVFIPHVVASRFPTSASPACPAQPRSRPLGLGGCTKSNTTASECSCAATRQACGFSPATDTTGPAASH
jgi:hypothetical protein